MAKGLRGAAGRAARDIDYAHKLAGFEREWLRQFLHDLPSDDAAQRDLMGKYWPLLGHPSRDDGDQFTSDEAPLLRESAAFPAYRCSRCLQRDCKCEPRQRRASYGIGDWQATPADPERLLIDAETEARALDLLPYGTSPANLAFGVRIKICIPKHYLNKCLGFVRAYRIWTDEYLIEADRTGKANDDGTRSQTTMCWVGPTALKLA